VAQAVAHLLYKCKALVSNHIPTKKKEGRQGGKKEGRKEREREKDTEKEDGERERKGRK
jgi:hypothetical protein